MFLNSHLFKNISRHPPFIFSILHMCSSSGLLQSPRAVFSGKTVTAMVVEDYIIIISIIVLPGSLKPLWCLNWRVLGWGWSFYLIFLAVVTSCRGVLSPGSQSWTEGSSRSRGKRLGLPSPGPTRGCWTLAGPGLSSLLAVHRRRWQPGGSSSSTQREPGTQTTPTSPAQWSRGRTIMITSFLRCDAFKLENWKVLPVQQKV